MRRADALERVADAVRRLGEVGAPQGILERAAEELGTSSDFGRVMLSEVRGAELHVRALWSRDDPGAAADVLEQLRARPGPARVPLGRGRGRSPPADGDRAGAGASLAGGPAAGRGARLGRLCGHGARGAGPNRGPAPCRCHRCRARARRARRRGRVSLRGGPRGRVRARSAAGDAPAAPSRAALGGRLDERAPRAARHPGDGSERCGQSRRVRRDGCPHRPRARRAAPARPRPDEPRDRPPAGRPGRHRSSTTSRTSCARWAPPAGPTRCPATRARRHEARRSARASAGRPSGSGARAARSSGTARHRPR